MTSPLCPSLHKCWGLSSPWRPAKPQRGAVASWLCCGPVPLQWATPEKALRAVWSGWPCSPVFSILSQPGGGFSDCPAPSHSVFILCVPDDQCSWVSLHVLVCCIAFGKVFSNFFVPFETKLGVFTVEYSVSGGKGPCQMRGLHAFSRSVAGLVTLFRMSFTEFLIFRKTSWWIQSLTEYTFFYIEVCDSFWVNFFYKAVGIKFIFVAYECSVVLEPFVERTIFSFWNDLSTFLEKQLALGVWFYFWTSFCFTDVSFCQLR